MLLPPAPLQPAQLLCGIAERGAHVHFMFVYRDPFRSACRGWCAHVLRMPGACQVHCMGGLATVQQVAEPLIPAHNVLAYQGVQLASCPPRSDGGYDDNISLSYKLPVREDAGALYGDGL